MGLGMGMGMAIVNNEVIVFSNEQWLDDYFDFQCNYTLTNTHTYTYTHSLTCIVKIPREKGYFLFYKIP